MRACLNLLENEVFFSCIATDLVLAWLGGKGSKGKERKGKERKGKEKERKGKEKKRKEKKWPLWESNPHLLLSGQFS